MVRGENAEWLTLLWVETPVDEKGQRKMATIVWAAIKSILAQNITATANRKASPRMYKTSNHGLQQQKATRTGIHG